MPPAILLLDRRLPIGEDVRQQLAASLSCGERQRLSAYRLAADRERFLLGRGGLRRLLGLWLGLRPEAVPLATGAHGKPHCPDGPRFNISHSGALILLALHPERPVGVDVERLRPGRDWPAIARRVLAPAELETIAGLPCEARPLAFLAAWCRLEAQLKARGEGLAGLARLRREPPLPAAAHHHAWDPSASAPQDQSSAIWNVAVPHGYRAAAALAADRR